MSDCDSCHKKQRVLCYDCSGRDELKRELATLKEENRVLREALEPYAKLSRFEWANWSPRLAKMERNAIDALAKRPSNEGETTWVQCTTITNDCLGGCRTKQEHERYVAKETP